MEIALVDLFSSGINLADAFGERGVSTFHIYEPQWQHQYDIDPAPGGKLIYRSFEQTRAELRRRGTTAVLPGGEMGVDLADRLAASLGLPHNDLALDGARRDKLKMIRAVESRGIPVAKTAVVSEASAVPAALEAFCSYPIVVKPSSSGGSDGLAVCDTPDQAARAVAAILGRSNLLRITNESVVLQEYLSGPQYSINMVTRNGRHALCSVALNRFDEFDGVPVWRSLRMLTELNSDDKAVVEYTLRCLDALGVTEGASNTEVRFTAEGPRLIEVNSRLGGPVLPPDVFFRSFGYSQATLLADSVLDGNVFKDRVTAPYRPHQCLATVSLQTPSDGSIKAMPGLDLIRRMRTFHSFSKLPKKDTEVVNRLLNVASAGVAYFVDPDPTAVIADVERVHRLEDSARLYEMTSV
ncbi:ATP-grasp domain-containing protein [Glycomyces buryatensis]|nr:ATP-grasp domain-containing protein [Glycomyces buryatensis]